LIASVLGCTRNNHSQGHDQPRSSLGYGSTMVWVFVFVKLPSPLDPPLVQTFQHFITLWSLMIGIMLRTLQCSLMQARILRALNVVTMSWRQFDACASLHEAACTIKRVHEHLNAMRGLWIQRGRGMLVTPTPPRSSTQGYEVIVFLTVQGAISMSIASDLGQVHS